jgi:membrane protein insertase Oxa1/YidC/SpoIIIJ
MARSFGPVVMQLPLFLLFFVSLRSLLENNPDVLVGGTLWFEDLTARDAFFRLNILTSVVMYASFRLGAELAQTKDESSTGLMKKLALVFPLIYLPLTYNFGQGMHLFWLSGSLAAIFVNVLLRKTPIGFMLGIPVPKAAIVPVPPQAFSSKADALKGKSASALAREHKKRHD